MDIKEIAKIIEYNASKVIDKITPEYIEPLIYIQSEFKNTNVSTDKTFQNIFCKYHKIDFKQVGPEYIANYFQYLENYKNTNKIDVEEICVALSYTKDCSGLIHPINYYYVSCFLNLINNQHPIWHKEFLKMFGIAEPYYFDTGKEIRYFEIFINLINNEFSEIIRLNLLASSLSFFDKKYPGLGISICKKLELLFLAFDMIHFLDVLFPEEDKILDDDSLFLN